MRLYGLRFHISLVLRFHSLFRYQLRNTRGSAAGVTTKRNRLFSRTSDREIPLEQLIHEATIYFYSKEHFPVAVHLDLTLCFALTLRIYVINDRYVSLSVSGE